MTVADLTQLLRCATSGRRVAVVEPLTAEHDLALQAAGFEVTCLAYSEEVLRAGRRRAQAHGVDIPWRMLESSFAPWPATDLDAVIDPAPCRTDAGMRRWVWRSARQAVVAGGPLILLNDLRSNGQGPAASKGQSTRPWTHLELANDLAAPLRDSGFAVTDADLLQNTADPMPPLVARALPTPPSSLAATAWAQSEEHSVLDLRYADDEADWLAPSPKAVWTDFVASLDGSDCGLVDQYPLQDPYGSVRGAPVVARYFDCALSPENVIFGAGVSTLLHDLSGLARSGSILAQEFVHPDLEAWAVTQGARLEVVPDTSDASALLSALPNCQPWVVHLDRPSFQGDVLSLDNVLTVAQVAKTCGAVVVVDESALPYLAAHDSAVQLVASTHNLVVLRGFTKGYSFPGLRAAFAVVSSAVSTRIREVIVPMQIGGLALELALRLLARADAFRHLRARLPSTKSAFVALLRQAGFVVHAGHELIPWVVVIDQDGSVESRLARLGIRGLAPARLPVLQQSRSDVIHLTVPLSPHRTALLQRLLAAEQEQTQDRAL